MCTSCLHTRLSSTNPPIWPVGALILLAIFLFWTLSNDNVSSGGRARGVPHTYSTDSSASAQTYGRHTRQCPALQYATITCPTWDAHQDDGGSDVDYRVRWIHNHQNPRESTCDDVNYLFRSHLDYIGFGGDIYLVLASALYLALYSDRIFLLNDNVPFRYAKCSSSQSLTMLQAWECYFMPLSRCTIREAERIGQYGDDYLNASHRVLRADKHPVGLAPHGPWSWYARKQEHPWWVKGFLFPGDEDVIAGTLLYALRPNARLREETEHILAEIFSKNCNFSPERTISMPIRGSDKCQGEMHLEGGLKGESECFTSLKPYMQMADRIRELDPLVDTIILTSEDQRYLDERDNYTGDGRWKFILNPVDTAKGSGTLTIVEKLHSLQDIFLSMYTSLQLQLKGKYYILNTGSNFHLLIKDLVKYGRCTPTHDPVVFPLDEQFAEFKLCHQSIPGGQEGCLQRKQNEILRKRPAKAS